MADLRAPMVGEGARGEAELDPAVFGAPVRPHLVHETVRAELNAQRAGTRAVKTRGQVSGGRAKPWRQKGTGRARQGTTRTVQWTGGSVAFEPRTNFEVKVNRKVRKAALRSILSAHSSEGTLGVIGTNAFDAPSAKRAAALIDTWGKDRPLVVVATEDEISVIKSFRNLERVAVTVPGELDVAQLTWARSVLVTEAALPLVQGRAV